MKIYTLLLLSLLALSCKKSTPAAKTTSGLQAGFIPNWQTDTLIAGSTTSHNGNYNDTIFANEIGDTSIVYYQGAKYYIWYLQSSVTVRVGDSQQVYINSYISQTPFDTTNAITSCSVFPAKYYDNNRWKQQRQEIMINNMAHFDAGVIQPFYYSK